MESIGPLIFVMVEKSNRFKTMIARWPLTHKSMFVATYKFYMEVVEAVQLIRLNLRVKIWYYMLIYVS